MVKLESTLTKKQLNSVRYCGNCKKEYTFNDFALIYPKSHYVQVMKLWQNQQIHFYCSYCYLLKVIKTIIKKKN
jgi:transcription elongation factor Elf1